MKGPGSSRRRSIARHCDMKTSSCAQVPRASSLASVIIRAPLGADSVELGPVVLDAAVPSDDQPPLASSLRNPVLVDRGRASDGTRWPLPPMYDASRVSGIGHV